MNGSLKIEKGRLVLSWGTGKDTKNRQVNDKDVPLIAAGFALDAMKIEGFDGLAKIAIEFEQANNVVTTFAVSVEAPQELKASWVAALDQKTNVATEEDIERISAAEFAQNLLVALEPIVPTTEEISEIAALILANRPLPPRFGVTAYNSWSAGFDEDLRLARNLVLGEPKTEGPKIPGVDDPQEVGDFRNPFHYVPTPARITSDPNLSDLGERSLTSFGHHRAQPGRFNGELTIRFNVETPTLILDHEAPVDLGNEHQGFHVARYNNAPIIQPTSARGLVRSLVRATTNSRFQTLPDKKGARRGGFRLGTSAAQRLVPCRLHLNNGAWTAELFIGTNTSPTSTTTQHAAWLPQGLTLSAGLPTTGQEVEAFARKTKHVRGKFEFWQVIQVRDLHTPNWGPEDDRERTRPDGTKKHVRIGTTKKTLTGVVFRTGNTAQGKHDERRILRSYCWIITLPYILASFLRARWVARTYGPF
jgi:hypothetical protein